MIKNLARTKANDFNYLNLYHTEIIATILTSIIPIIILLNSKDINLYLDIFQKTLEQTRIFYYSVIIILILNIMMIFTHFRTKRFNFNFEKKIKINDNAYLNGALEAVNIAPTIIRSISSGLIITPIYMSFSGHAFESYKLIILCLSFFFFFTQCGMLITLNINLLKEKLLN